VTTGWPRLLAEFSDERMASNYDPLFREVLARGDSRKLWSRVMRMTAARAQQEGGQRPPS